jgi:hypothetical protein
VQNRVQCVRTPMNKPNYDRITTTIEREWLAQIIAGTKKIEHREIKPYWTKRFAKVSVPFELRPLNGMNPPVPEVTVLIHRITKDRRAGEYRLHIKKVSGIQALGQAAAKTQTVIARFRTFSCFELADRPAPVSFHSSKPRFPRPSCRGARRIAERPRCAFARSGTDRCPKDLTGSVGASVQ